MSIALTFAVIFLLSFSISELFGKSFVEGVPCAVCIIILVLYASGFVGAMQPASYILIVLPFLLFILTLAQRKMKLKLSFANISGMLIFTILFAYFWYIGRTSLICDYDEFSHWALVVKNMFLNNNFGNIEPTTATFLTYPPAQGLFEYFFLKICRSYSESRMILATNVFLFSFILPIFKKSKNFISSGVCTALLLSLLFAVNNAAFRSTYVDVLLGVIWGYIIYTLFDETKDAFSCFSLSLALAVLTLTKASGFGLAIGSVIVYAVIEAAAFIKTRNNSVKTLKFVLFPTIVLLAAKFSWSLYVNYHNLEEKFEFSAFSLDSLTALLNGTAPEYRYKTLNNFTRAFFDTNIFKLHIGFPAVLMLLIPAAVLIVIYFVSRKDGSKSALHSAVTYFAVTGIYILGLLFSYLFSFSEYEAVTLASFSRYLSTAAACAVVMLSYYLFNFIRKQNLVVSACAALVLCLAINPCGFVNNMNYYQEMNAYANSFRGTYDWENELIQKHCPADSTLLYMAPGSADLVRLQAQYAFTPVSIVYPYNFSPDGEKYYEESATPNTVPMENLRSHLIDNCDYVFVHKALPEFCADYAELFETDTVLEGLYMVDKSTGTLSIVELLQ